MKVKPIEEIAANMDNIDEIPIYKELVPFINTIDLIDAVYGILGVIISLIYLLFIDKKGFDN